MQRSTRRSIAFPFTRRSFLRTALAAGAGAMGAPAIARSLGTSERLGIGVIGCGGMGTHHLSVYKGLAADPRLNIALVGVCHVYEPRLSRAKEVSGAEAYRDYRKLLERPDLNGVIIATPDHWHARMSIDAMEAGKDVHVEKPMTLHWHEARELAHTARRLKRVVQVGAEGCSQDRFWQANRAIRDGKIGKVIWTTGGVYRNVAQGDWNYSIDPSASLSNLDWKAFLGPAPDRPFDPERFFRYRKYWDYSGGVSHDLIAHVLSALMVALGPEFPRRVMASGGIHAHPDREVPDTFSILADYPKSHSIALFCTQASEEGVGTVIRGNRASIHFPREREEALLKPERAGDGLRKRGEGGVRAAKPPSGGERLPTEPRDDHDRNWISCMRSRLKPHCDFETGLRVMAVIGLAMRSYREDRVFLFDPEKEDVV